MSDPIMPSIGERVMADRLYDLLDTLIAARTTFELADDGREGTAALGPKRGAEVRLCWMRRSTPRNVSSEASTGLSGDQIVLARQESGVADGDASGPHAYLFVTWCIFPKSGSVPVIQPLTSS